MFFNGYHRSLSPAFQVVSRSGDECVVASIDQCLGGSRGFVQLVETSWFPRKNGGTFGTDHQLMINFRDIMETLGITCL